MLRYFFLLLLLGTLLLSKEYPKTFSQLGSPLFDAKEHFIKLEKFKLLQKPVQEYNSSIHELLEEGYRVDASRDKKAKLHYLQKLRAQQKAYDKLLSLLHQNIDKSIDREDYKSFITLTEYPFDGLFQNRSLKNRAIEFYDKNKTKCRCKVLDKEMSNMKLLEETSKFFEAEIIKSSYNSSSKKRTNKKVYIKTSRNKNTITVTLVNKNIYPVTLKIKPFYHALRPKNRVKNEMVLEANSKTEYTNLSIVGSKSSYRYQFSWLMGSMYAKHDDNYLYTLPYKKGTKHRVSQGYNGKKTHKGRSAYSIDFPMPIGTEVYASRDGIVIKTKANSNRGGYDKKFASSGNYVRILHKDGTLATYYHLKQHGVLVKVGQRVHQGEKIGYSGNTGYSSGPHLHFSVFKAKNASQTQTIPIKILSSEGIITDPLIGKYYISK